MELLQEAPTGAAKYESPQMEAIRANIQELTNMAIASSKAATSQEPASEEDAAALLAEQAKTLQTFRDMMSEVQRLTSKASSLAEAALLPSDAAAVAAVTAIAPAAPLQDLPGIEPGSTLHRALCCTESSNGKPSYKLRDTGANLPSSVVVPHIVVAPKEGEVSMPRVNGQMVVLQPTLRNVFVIQHAYAKMLKHKEALIAEYLAHRLAQMVPGQPPVSRKYARAYYENLSLAALPSKNKLGNLLDVKSSTYHEVTGDITLVIVSPSPSPDGSDSGHLTIVEAVTGNTVDPTTAMNNHNSYLTLPMTEGSIQQLYTTYKALREATSDLRRASRDRQFAATQPVDPMAELEMQFNFGSGDVPGENTHRAKRRMLED